MNKTEQLLEMLEHPERYGQEQWQEILADEECRELYTIMAKTQSAFAAERADVETTDEFLDSEWQRLSTAHQSTTTFIPLWHKIAAAAAIVIAFFGITIAAVHTNLFGLTQPDDVVADSEIEKKSDNDLPEEVVVEQSVDTSAAMQPRLYDNVPLEQILGDLATHYGVEVEYRTDDVRSLRLFYQWEPDYSLDKVVEMLNNFEVLYIRQEGNKLIVEPANAQ